MDFVVWFKYDNNNHVYQIWLLYLQQLLFGVY